MLQQYFRVKAEHPGVLLAMRVGDFYEFYGEDAEKAASTLEIVLTAREDGGQKIPMAGVPFHAVERYLARLVAAGLKVALCDQLEDPKAAKGLVKRGVTRVLTPGTLMEDAMLPAGQNNFLAAICVQDGRAGLALLDSSTGEFVVTEVEGDQLEDRLLQELARIRPSELLVGPKAESFGEIAHSALGSAVTDTPALSPERAARKLLDQFSGDEPPRVRVRGETLGGRRSFDDPIICGAEIGCPSPTSIRSRRTRWTGLCSSTQPRGAAWS